MTTTAEILARETLERRLREAEEALHQLLTGTLSVEVDYNGVKTKFAATEEAKLRAYIGDLKRQLTQSDAPQRRAISPVVGF